MTNKMTNAKALAYVLANFDLPTEVGDKLVAMKESYEKKSANRKPTKTQAENEAIKTEILATLTDAGVTVTELQGKSDTLNALSNQRVSALLRQLVEAGIVTKTIDKKKSYFSIAKAE